MNTPDEQQIKAKEKTLLIALGSIVLFVLILAIVGFLFLKPEADIYQGQADATQIRISGKLPGRIAEFYVVEGQAVKTGDTLVRIHSPLVDAQLMEAQAMEQSVSSQNKKIDAGTRKQIVNAAHDLWQQALAAQGIAKKTYDRLQNLYTQDVISEQKRDEAKAAYDAAVSAANAAKSQYDLALAGAQQEDKESSQSLVTAAQGSVQQVQAILEDSYLVAPCDGEITDIYPELSELVAPGAPIMSLLKMDDMWLVFNVREEMLESLPMGKEEEVMIPALGKKKIKAKVYYIKDLGAYAVWNATKTTGQYDSKTFEVKMRPADKVNNLRPGMSAIIEK